MSTETEGLNLHLEFARVEITRPWLDSSLFSLDNYRLQAYAPGTFSTGEATDPPNSGVFSLLPVSFIVARNIRISASWGREDRDRLMSSTTAGGSVGWGPFKLSGNYSTRRSTSEVTSKFENETLSIPGVQVIAWIDRIIPFCPPTVTPPTPPSPLPQPVSPEMFRIDTTIPTITAKTSNSRVDELNRNNRVKKRTAREKPVIVVHK
jgi:hypothetical protein